MRVPALVIAGAMLVWMGGSWLGGRLGLPPAAAIALDLACLAALAWAGVAALRAGSPPRD